MSPSQVTAGEQVDVSGQHRDLCLSSEPPHDIRVQARPAGTADPFVEIARVTTDSTQPSSMGSGGSFDVPEHPTQSTQYRVLIDGRTMWVAHDTQTNQPLDTVTITRTAGSCAGAVTLTAPATPTIGTVVPVTGSTSDTGTVTISFRKRGQSTFQIRRTLTPSPNGTFGTSFVADDDYRLYAATARCDSQPILVQAQPTITGPATTRPGSTVTLTVRAAAGVPVRVYFHRAGTVGYALRRTGSTGSTGRYTTTYLADADYRYYAATGPDGRTSNTGLTQAR